MKKATTLFFILILLLAAGMAGFWVWQGNEWSKEDLKLEILSLEKVKAGEEIDYAVRFKNNGKVRFEDVELSFQYPDQVIPLEGNSQRVVKKIADIYPGEERIESFRALVLGKDNDRLEAKVLLTYRPKNLKAPFDSQTTFTSQVESVPLTFEFDLPLKTASGEEIAFSLNYFSNIDYLLEGLRIKIEYPDGFQFLSSVPSALDETEWQLPVLSKADGGKVNIKGIIEGDEGSKKFFKAQLGIVRDSQFIALKETIEGLEITEPSLYVSQLINGSQNYTANPGDLLHYEVYFKNIGRTPIQKKFLFVRIEGDFFDLSSLKSDNGEVGNGDNSIIWDWKAAPSLRFLDASEEGSVDFWIDVKEEMSSIKQRNPVLRTRITLGGSQKVFTTKINSQPELYQKVYFEEEVFGNSGPLPPEVDRKTTYTVFWQITNTWNMLENVKVKAILPENVTVTGKFFPEDAKFTFDSLSKEVMWNVIDVEAFQGYGDKEDDLPLTLAFQIELTPDSSQAGETPLLIKEAELLAQDTFTGDPLQALATPIDTTLPDDETTTEQQGVVQ